MRVIHLLYKGCVKGRPEIGRYKIIPKEETWRHEFVRHQTDLHGHQRFMLYGVHP